MVDKIRKGKLFLKETLEGIVESENWPELGAVLRENFLQDIANLLKYFPAEKNAKILMYLGPERAGVLLRETDRLTRNELTHALEDYFLSAVLDSMAYDDAADILGRLPEEQREKLLKLVKPERAEEMKELLQYPHDTAGGVMNSNFVAINEKSTLEQAIAQVREKTKGFLAPRIFVVDDNEVLKGYVPTAKLLGRDTGAPIGDVMLTHLVTVSTGMDQEEVAQIVTKYDLYTVPVVDEESRLVGIITVDDVVEIIHDEASEDALKLSGTSVNELGEKSAIRVARTRMPWLMVSWLQGILAMLVIGWFEGELEKAVILSAFIPVIMAMGGNAGMQAATVVVRGLAMGDITRRDIMQVLFREFRVGIALGVTFGVLLGIVTHLLYVKSFENLGIVVGLAILVEITLGVLAGTFLPIFFKRVNADPAVATAPFVTASLDISGIVIFFYLAKVILPL